MANTNNMNKSIALQNLIDIRDVLNEMGIDYFLAYGTCLGAIREENFIDYDLDTDIGILDENFNFSLINRLARQNFAVRYIFGMRHCGFELALYRNGVKTDIMLHYKKDDKRWTALWKNGGRNGMSDIIKIVFDADIFESRTIVELDGHSFKVLSKSEDYLRAYYGEEWRTPTKQWRWQDSSPAINNNFQI